MIRVVNSVFFACCLSFPLSSQGACPSPENLSTPDVDFINHDNGLVTHQPTALVWKTCSEGQAGNHCAEGTPLSLSWQDAISLATSANAARWGGHNDWRLPNVKELQSLVEVGCYNPSINEKVFPNTPGNLFWSSTSLAVATGEAWGVAFGSGYVIVKNKKSTLAHVRLVRGGLAEGGFDSQTEDR